MKKIIAMMYILYILICLASCGSLNDSDKTLEIKEYGTIMNLAKAYEEEILSYDDLLQIAYDNNNGKEYNESQFPENFTPKNHIELGEEIKNKILLTLQSKEDGEYSIDSFYGSYGNAYIIKYNNKLDNILNVVSYETIAEVYFFYPTYPIMVFLEK